IWARPKRRSRFTAAGSWRRRVFPPWLTWCVWPKWPASPPLRSGPTETRRRDERGCGTSVCWDRGIADGRRNGHLVANALSPSAADRGAEAGRHAEAAPGPLQPYFHVGAVYRRAGARVEPAPCGHLEQCPGGTTLPEGGQSGAG